MRFARSTIAALAPLLVLGCGLRSERAEPRAVADPTTLRTLGSGGVVGTAGRYGGHAWLGVPYAKPPVGALRWRAPEPPDGWSGTHDALAFASPCPQLASHFGGIYDAKPGTPTGSEDCLYVNVWTPAFAADRVPSGDARLPVMVWIHGGGNSIGHGGFFDGSRLATTQGLVVVTLNYRLGPLGWFRHAALRAEGTSDAERSGNFGTLDLIRALAWVRDNASAFGGDPHRVTIFGESAGGAHVVTLLASPLARGLFQRAIAESAGTRTSTLDEAEHPSDDPAPGHAHSSAEVVLALLVADGTAADRAAAKSRLAEMRPDEVARYLRAKTSAELLTVAAEGNMNGFLDFPSLFTDGVVLPRESPFDALGRADAPRVPVILGTTRDETRLFLFTNPAYVRRWFGIVPRVRDAQQYEIAAEYTSKMWKAAAADEPATRLRRVQGPNVWVYRFDWHEEPTILGTDLSVMLGAAHAFEVPFVFGHFDLGREANVIWTKANEPGRAALSAAMMSYWAEFAWTGDPSAGRHGELPRWGAWDDVRPQFLVLDTPAAGGIRTSSEVLTKATVVAAIEADPRMPSRGEKCACYGTLTQWPGRFTRDDYAAACATFPLARRP